MVLYLLSEKFLIPRGSLALHPEGFCGVAIDSQQDSGSLSPRLKRCYCGSLHKVEFMTHTVVHGHPNRVGQGNNTGAIMEIIT